MGKLLEVVRRLAIAITWLIGGAIGLGLLFNGYEQGDNEMMMAGAVGLLVTYFVHRVLNWILLKEDKPFQD